MKFARLQKRLGKRLAQLRVENGLTQQEAADRCEITRQHLQRIEYGQANPKASTLFALAKTYRVPLAEIVGDEKRLKRPTKTHPAGKDDAEDK